MAALKPWQLVRVTVEDSCESGRRSFIGQTVSYPTPNNTIMVRTVPGMEATAKEFNIDANAVTPVKGFRWLQLAVVMGRGSFPVDMLRYDSCVPVNFRIELQDGMHRVVMDEGHTEMLVADVTETRMPRWTAARWSSFLWGIRHHSTAAIAGGQG